MSAGPTPKPTPLTQPFWDGTLVGELRIQTCDDCGRSFFYPRPLCRYCHSTNWVWGAASGKATLASYVINRRPFPMFESAEPQIIALVDLAEGPRMATNLVGVAADPAALRLGMPLTVQFEPRGDQALPVFIPTRGASE